MYWPSQDQPNNITSTFFKLGSYKPGQDLNLEVRSQQLREDALRRMSFVPPIYGLSERKSLDDGLRGVRLSAGCLYFVTSCLRFGSRPKNPTEIWLATGNKTFYSGSHSQTFMHISIETHISAYRAYQHDEWVKVEHRWSASGLRHLLTSGQCHRNWFHKGKHVHGPWKRVSLKFACSQLPFRISALDFFIIIVFCWIVFPRVSFLMGLKEIKNWLKSTLWALSSVAGAAANNSTTIS